MGSKMSVKTLTSPKGPSGRGPARTDGGHGREGESR